jgi:hypothetical protein
VSDQPPPPPPPTGPPEPPEPPDYGSGPFTPAEPPQDPGSGPFTPAQPPEDPGSGPFTPAAPQVYQQPYQVPQGRPTNGMAIASLIMGISGFLCLPGLGSILALIFGYLGKGQVARSQGAQDGRGMALAGIVLGWIGLILTLVVAGLIVASVIAVVESEGADAIVDEFEQGFNEGLLDAVDEATAGCTPVEEHPDMGRAHINESEAAVVSYNSEPPTSGPHFDIPAEPGFYTTPVEAPTLVHNLEHGQIVIWYAPDAEQRVRDQLAFLTAQEPLATVATPYGNIPEGSAFVLTAWQHSQACDLPSQEVFDSFRRQFQGNSPEPITPPFEG